MNRTKIILLQLYDTIIRALRYYRTALPVTSLHSVSAFFVRYKYIYLFFGVSLRRN